MIFLIQQMAFGLKLCMDVLHFRLLLLEKTFIEAEAYNGMQIILIMGVCMASTAGLGSASGWKNIAFIYLNTGFFPDGRGNMDFQRIFSTTPVLAISSCKAFQNQKRFLSFFLAQEKN